MTTRATGRPYVICHMCTSLDGKILARRWEKLRGVGDSGSLFERTAASFGVPAWLVGTKTMQEFAAGSVQLPDADASTARADHLAAPQASSFAIGADAHGVLRFKRGDVQGDHVVLLVSHRVSDGYLAHLRSAGVSYLFCGQELINLKTALRKIGQKLRLRKLMLEGGGTFNGAMLKEGLIDEVSQVILPVIDGSVGISSVFDMPGRPLRRAAARLRLVSQRALPGGVQWLRYRIARRAAGRGDG
jgi:2,5-diamino-6-(ribosylamino)-4(3H)-pyrimidinone 5'-phosphate reductase